MERGKQDEAGEPRTKKSGPRRRSDLDHACDLSAREKGVVERLIEGLSLKQVASEFSISVHTASTYLLRARRKHGSGSRWKLAAGLLGPYPSLSDLLAANQAEVSPDERLVGLGVLAGLSNREIGSLMGIDERLAGRLVSRLLRKLNCNTRAELFARAFRHRHNAPRSRRV